MRARGLEILLISGLIFAYGWFHPFFPISANPNEITRFYMTRALVQRGELKIDEEFARYGVSLDRSRYNGHYYSDKAPGLSLLSVPFYWAYEQWRGKPETWSIPPWEDDERLEFSARASLKEVSPAIRFLKWPVIIVPSILLSLMVFAALAGLIQSRVLALSLTLAYGLGTVAYSNSLILFSHQLTAALLFGAYLCLRRGLDRDNPWWFVPAGACAGMTLMVEFPPAIPIFLMGVYAIAVLKKRFLRLLPYPLFAAPFIAGLLYYHYLAFDNPFSTGYSHLEEETFTQVHNQGLLGITLPDHIAFFGMFFAPQRGILVFSPMLLFAIPGFVEMKRRRSVHFWPVTLVSLAFFYIVSSYPVWHGGGCVGMRHLTPLMPFLMIPTALGVQRLAGRSTPWWGRAAGGFMLAGCLLTIVSTVPFPHAALLYRIPFRDLGGELWRLGFLPPSAVSAMGMDGYSSGLWYLAGAALLCLAMLIALTRWMSSRETAGSVPENAGWMVLIGSLILLIWFVSFPDFRAYDRFNDSRLIMRQYHPQHRNVYSRFNWPPTDADLKQPAYWRARGRERTAVLDNGGALDFFTHARQLVESPATGTPAFAPSP
ncbi:MAG: hypothetical protein GMKNLPBB_01101 [Myxococcota bacterium]|nr:hypothetical protein [Myxococcota bacterium]